jgi:hypothetical protein
VNIRAGHAREMALAALVAGCIMKLKSYMNNAMMIVKCVNIVAQPNVPNVENISVVVGVYKMENYAVEKSLVIEGRQCYVIKMIKRWHDNDYCNGYIEIRTKTDNYDDYNREANLSEEATFLGKLPIDQTKIFLGFDTIHWCDNEATQNPIAVENRLREFAKGVIAYDY